MIVVTGGLGFIGSHTARAIADLGQRCIATRHRQRDAPAFLADERIAIADLDLTDRAAVLALGDRDPISGIVHLGGALSNPFDELRDTSRALANVLEAAAAWKVRICIASAIGIYAGVAGDYREDAQIPLLGFANPIVAMKKTAEVYAELAVQGGIDCVVLRIGAIYGPGYRRHRSLPSRLAHAVARGTPLDLTGLMFGSTADDGGDWCYVKDAGRAIALLATAPALRHRTYNVGCGMVSYYRELIAIARELAPDASIAPLAPAANPPVVRALDIARLHADTNFTPAFPLRDGFSDYLAWLAAGNAY